MVVCYFHPDRLSFLTLQGKITQSSHFSQVSSLLNQNKIHWRFQHVFIASVGEVALENHDLFMTYHRQTFSVWTIFTAETSVEVRSFYFLTSLLCP